MEQIAIHISVKEFQRLRRLSSYNGARKGLVALKKKLGKQPNQDITPYEYADHYGIPVELVMRVINQK